MCVDICGFPACCCQGLCSGQGRWCACPESGRAVAREAALNQTSPAQHTLSTPARALPTCPAPPSNISHPPPPAATPAGKYAWLEVQPGVCTAAVAARREAAKAARLAYEGAEVMVEVVPSEEEARAAAAAAQAPGGEWRAWAGGPLAQGRGMGLRVGWSVWRAASP